ncbi:MAG: hypothetical protein ACI4LN_09605, partial [Anaerovoracaceae bacterium]
SLEHKINYKFDGDTPASFKRELKECADIAAFLDRKMEALSEEVKYYRPAQQYPSVGDAAAAMPGAVEDAMFGEVVNG